MYPSYHYRAITYLVFKFNCKTIINKKVIELTGYGPSSLLTVRESFLLLTKSKKDEFKQHVVPAVAIVEQYQVQSDQAVLRCLKKYQLET